MGGMEYSIQQLAKKAGVTTRALRHYDAVGLLSPSRLGKNGYRHYGEPELVRLQQVLFYRELDYPLPEIKRLLDHPRFNVVESLTYQKGMLQLKKKRLEGIIKTINETINAMNNNQPVSDQDMYGSLSQKEIESYKKEAKERWGNTDAYRQSQERVKKFTKEDWQKIKADTDANLRALVALLDAGKKPDDPEVQAEVVKHHAGIDRFYDCTMQIYRGLAEGYVADQRFADFYREYDERLPEFLSAAMKVFCDEKERTD